ncbi:protein kinase domain-containing protein [Amycolatopsis sp. cmx-4-83]|uniref:protein kinase domain-containing protein n=1 Tax=Amycolatopsis sp. cmx-4-83 TaxID=2790940 RepID=UPI00397C2B37
MARGGFATVYRGVQESFHREVAVKVFHTALPDRRSRDSFSAECEAIGRLPSGLDVVTMFHSGVIPGSDGRPYVVMELCRESLAARIARGPLRPDEVAVLGARLAVTLHAVHDAGLVHGDITPSNVLFRPTGQPVLGDFGLTLHADADGARADYATWEHAGPEVYQGRSSFASDVYGLGSTLYTALTGRPPIPRAQGESLRDYRLRAVATPAPGLPETVAGPEFSAVLGKALAADPDARHVSANDFATELATLSAPPVTPQQWVPDTAYDGSASTGLRPSAGSFPAGFVPGTETGLRPAVPEPEQPKRMSAATRWLIAGAAALVVVTGGGLTVLLTRDTSPPPAAAPGPSPAPTSPVTAVAAPVLAPPEDLGAQVRLSWTGEPDWDYAVVIAEEGGSAPTVKLADRQTTYTVDVTASKKYCFQIQATWDSGNRTAASESLGIRQAQCVHQGT